MKKPRTVDDFIESQEQWKEPLIRLRSILLSTELEETVKWNFPVYTLKGHNVAGLGAFQSYVGIWFFQGALLKDKHQRLVNAQEGKTQAMRQLRFYSAEEIDEQLVKEYLAEAILEKERTVISRAWKKGMPIEEIADLVDVPVEKVKTVIEELKEGMESGRNPED